MKLITLPLRSFRHKNRLKNVKSLNELITIFNKPTGKF